ncbi:Regulator of nonsense transcripts 3A [Trichoplax sp. H2]|nr:Regulator of nonsense transcripts 3A [Trichoplax sp. H2]|eukprot:RDD47716.1 Regulator of nonsense transcripts 3A [Trichoplax sp. H2]
MSKSTSRKSFKQSKEKNNTPHKIIIRCLPANLTEEQFLEQISPLPTYSYFRFVAADNSYGRHSFCRAYVNFVNAKDIVDFFEKYDGYPISDSKGKQFPAIVEFAPFQRIPKKKKRDPKCSTIESDKDFLAFMASLADKKDLSHISQAPIDIEDTKDDNLLESTPLLDYVKARKSGNKSKQSQNQISANEAEKKRKKEKKTENTSEQAEIGSSKKSIKHDPPKSNKDSSRSSSKKSSSNHKVEKDKEKKESNVNEEHKNAVRNKDRISDKRDSTRKATELKQNHRDKSKGSEREKETKDRNKDRKIMTTSASAKRNEDRERDSKSERREKSASKKSMHASIPQEKSKKQQHTDEKEGKATKKLSSNDRVYDNGKRLHDKDTSKARDEREQQGRIRNKDRPDRAVYNPRQRFGRSSEGDMEEKRPRSSRSQGSKK